MYVYFSLQLLHKTLFGPINIYRVKFEGLTEMNVRLPVKVPLVMSYFMQN